MNSVLYLWNSLQWIRFLSTQRPAFPAYSGVPGGLIFSAVVAGVCAVAWWRVLRKARWARIWAIAASLTFLAIFIRPFVIPLKPVWGRHIGSLFIAVVGLVVFLRPRIWADVDSTF